MTNIVYQAYGKKESLYQTIFSAHSLLEMSEKTNFRIVIYTDQISFLEKFFSPEDPISYELLSPEQMVIWKGPYNFNHRMKIEILKDCSNKYDGNILYLDGDTYFTKDISHILDQIKEDQSVMHVAEGNLKNSTNYLAKKIYKFLIKTPIFLYGKQIKIDSNYTMWNAGAIGLHRKNHGIFQSIIDYTDELFVKYPKHLMEQHAVSYYLQSIGKVVSCEDALEHYWNQKDSFEEIINPFFEKHQSIESYKLHRHALILPKRHYGKPRYTFKQKFKRKIQKYKNLFWDRA